MAEPTPILVTTVALERAQLAVSRGSAPLTGLRAYGWLVSYAPMCQRQEPAVLTSALYVGAINKTDFASCRSMLPGGLDISGLVLLPAAGVRGDTVPNFLSNFVANNLPALVQCFGEDSVVTLLVANKAVGLMAGADLTSAFSGYTLVLGTNTTPTPATLSVVPFPLSETKLVRVAGTAVCGRENLLRILRDSPSSAWLGFNVARPPVRLDVSPDIPPGSLSLAWAKGSSTNVLSPSSSSSSTTAAAAASSSSSSLSSASLSSPSLSLSSLAPGEVLPLPPLCSARLLISMSSGPLTDGFVTFSPVSDAPDGDAPCFFDLMTYMPADSTIAEAVQSVRRALIRQLKIATELRTGLVRHFQPPQLPHLITVCYPASQREVETADGISSSATTAAQSTLSSANVMGRATGASTPGRSNAHAGGTASLMSVSSGAQSEAKTTDGASTVIANAVIAASDENSQELRLEMYRRLLFPRPRPCLRAHHAITVPSGTGFVQAVSAVDSVNGHRAPFLAYRGDQEASPPCHARNVHRALELHTRSQLAQPSRMALVDGSYDYFHYLQDDVNDAGWGCAYRSLQTCASWLQLNGFATRPPPLHAEIQRVLAAVNDKPPSFVGSSEWIGAVEVGMVIEQLYGISYRVIRVNKGSEFVDHVPELVAHFQTEGSPIMIGGGVLAYTLLGVDWNDASGDCRFLILDPHYSFAGESDLEVVRKKGWCAWKPVSIFRDDVFYNCCCLLPSRSVDLL